jgi:PD-(D/E)XK nuclease superfamily protein
MNFPLALDSTMISAFRSCPQKFFREYLEHWKPKEPSVPLHAGSAYAKGLEVARRAYYEQGHSIQDAEALGLEALIKAYGDFDPGDSPKSLGRMAGALEFYFSQYPLDQDAATPLLLGPGERRAIEFSFAIPLPIPHPETGDPILYCGRCDMLVDFANGLYGLDDKTTSSLGPQWAKQWQLRSQFIGYCWSAGQAGIDLSGFLIRGVSILKTKYDTQQAMINISPFLIERWYKQLLTDINQMLEMWWTFNNSGDSSAFNFNLDHACTEYGGCPFVRVCGSPNPQNWLPMSFTKRIWNPLTREEKGLES